MNPSQPTIAIQALDPLAHERAAVHAAVQAFCAAQEKITIKPSSIPPSGKVIGQSEIQAMVDAALDGWLTTGRFNRAFEEQLAAFIGVAHALTVNSGSSANLVALSSLFSPQLGSAAIQPGDEIITVAAGFPTTVNPIIQNQAVPVFVDIDLATYNIDSAQLQGALSTKTRAVMLAHTLGNPFDLETVVQFCAQHNLWLIEDCCDALGSTYTTPSKPLSWRPKLPDANDDQRWIRVENAANDAHHVGTFGHMATLSFYPAHHITMGEGGAVFTALPSLRRIAESIRDWGRDCWCAPGADNTCQRRFDQQLGELPHGYDHKYTYSHLGYNLKITDMQAACALAQLERLPTFIQQRRNNFQYLHDRLSALDEFLTLPSATSGAHPSWFGFPITLKASADTRRRDLLTWLDQQGVGTRLLFAGNLTRQPYFAQRQFRQIGDLACTDVVMDSTFWVGLWPGLSTQDLDYTCHQIEQFFGLHFD